ncbi:cell division FtsZ family protein [Luteolibacter pohnpeiensis]|uniref:Cell division protein FtsZ n=1 Tax=Luteolibacter pohnpeiensis TaxID=454153 RepID=A0A934SDB0_9BACT|nr:cell division protein FtsZ [Luteolibacter pohnpeiensis]MBK1883143.1 cell division FtsZ family protein [Luteolibacter pohnpeiensis]
MISYTRDPQQTIPTSSVKIIGLGGAGANMLERVALDGLEGAELLATNTDIRALSAFVGGQKIQLGRNLTKGLGAGGDPELGQQAILEAEDEIRSSLKGRRIVFLCVGLGGGTGSGAAPIITRIAREEGAFVVVFATMPFAFEGRRRREQADTALNELAVLSNALVTFDNNRMGELVLAKQGIHEAFSAADHMICESIKAVIRLVIRPGLINVGLDDLMSALRTNRSRCLFGSGLAKGKDRAARALRNALASPLLDQGALLKDAQTVLVHLSGGEDLTLYEIELLMQGLQKFVPEKAHVLFGAAVDPAMADSLSITLISALPEDHLAAAPRDSLSKASRENPLLDPSDGFTSYSDPEPEPEEFEEEPEPEPEPEPLAKVVPLTRYEPEPEPEPEIQPEPEPEPEPEPKFIPQAAPKEEPPVQVAPEPEPEPKPEQPAPFIADPEEDDEPPFAETTYAPRNTKGKSEDEMDAFTFFDNPAPAKAPAKKLWGKPVTDELPEQKPASSQPERPREAIPSVEQPKLKLGGKPPGNQSELSFESAPRGRFEGQSPNVVDGEDLDLPPFLRKKR